MRVPAIVLLLLLLLAGCSSGEEATRSTETAGSPAGAATRPTVLPSPPYPGAGVDCPSKAPSPLSIRRTIEVLRTHGFTVGELDDSCGARFVSAMVSNAGSGTAPFVMRREGLVSCFVLVEPRPAAPAVVEGDATATTAERTLANLHCRLYGPERRGFEAYVRRLDAAFSELRHRLAP